LKAKCFSCHNEKKSKGGLIMTTEEKILLGGKNGPVWKAGDAANSHLVQNINLPEEHKKHMPPKGKPQITKEEAGFLFLWIQSGADMKKKLGEYHDTDTIKTLAQKFISRPQKETEKIYPFAAAAASLIEKLNSPFCAVFPLAQNSPALQADFFVREKFEREKLKELLKIKEQLVVLNLGNMPVADEDMKIIGQFANLEKLILNNSSITNKGLEEIKKLKLLRSLSVAGTKTGKNAATIFSQLDSLKEVFVWNSGITAADAKELQKQITGIRIDPGYIPDENEILNLTPPMLRNEEFVLKENDKIELKHPVAGVQIRYTTDGSIPDSTSSQIYNSPITTNGFVVVKTRATKAGWYSSPVTEFSFFKKGIKPARAEFINQPDEKYKGEGATSLFDDKKGPAESFSDAAWLGFREKPFAAVFYFDEPKTINSISISYNKSVQSYIMPPESIEIWAGEEKNMLRLLKKLTPEPTSKEELNVVRAEGIKIEIPQSSFGCYKIVVKNISRLPSWHPGKGDKGWVFIDEIFFN
jgi:Leucine-rich repeat (LRR) protein